MKNIANYITMARVILAISLLFTKVFGSMFMLIYLICGTSDVLDGYIARKMGIESRWGSRMDSIADFITFTVITILIYPQMELADMSKVIILIIVMVRIISILVTYIKYSEIGVLHTYGNKITGIVVFLIPFIIAFNLAQDVLVNVICLIALLSATEELFIHLTSCEFNRDNKSIMVKAKRK